MKFGLVKNKDPWREGTISLFFKTCTKKTSKAKLAGDEKKIFWILLYAGEGVTLNRNFLLYGYLRKQDVTKFWKMSIKEHPRIRPFFWGGEKVRTSTRFFKAQWIWESLWIESANFYTEDFGRVFCQRFPWLPYPSPPRFDWTDFSSIGLGLTCFLGVDTPPTDGS